MEADVLVAASVRDLPDLVRATRPPGVLLDVGGVLADDVWERLLLDPTAGLAVRHGLDVDRVRAVGLDLWQRVCRSPADEEEWWSELTSRLGVALSGRARADLYGGVRGNDDARPVLEEMVSSGVRVGLASNNTSFWLPRQLALAGVGSLVDPASTFLSCERGVTKGDRPGLLERAAAQLPGWVLVDDRPANLARAAELGLLAVQVRFGTAQEGLS